MAGGGGFERETLRAYTGGDARRFIASFECFHFSGDSAALLNSRSSEFTIFESHFSDSYLFLHLPLGSLSSLELLIPCRFGWRSLRKWPGLRLCLVVVWFLRAGVTARRGEHERSI